MRSLPCSLVFAATAVLALSVSCTPSTPPLNGVTNVSPKPPNNALAGATFAASPNTQAAAAAQRLHGTPEGQLIEKIANVPTASWFGDWSHDLRGDVSRHIEAVAAKGGLPILVAYNVPNRDCGNHSKGGTKGAEQYKKWIREFVTGFGGKRVVVILEPDALPLMDQCLSPAEQDERMALIADAVQVLQKAGAIVYIDAGHSAWKPAEVMAERLIKAGIAAADGFALNVSNYRTTEDNIAYGKQLAKLVSGKHFIIDTSRNGKGPLGQEWCNPKGRGTGTPTTTVTADALCDGYLWIKPPGESDGPCNGGPAAGLFWVEAAVEMAKNGSF